MAQTKETPEFFPPIADIVDRTHAADEENVDSRPLEEIESLCMQCGEQVHSLIFR
jgi:zinc finger protein